MSFGNIYDGLPVLITGHTGFKGSWLTLWLHELGAMVAGLSLPEPPSVPSNFELLHLDEKVVDARGDVRDLAVVQEIIASHRPRLIFHLAAQPLVPLAYREPKMTFDTNVGGTVNVLEAARQAETVEAVICITTDKVYANREWAWGYRENDRLGGDDPYSASKAMAELAAHAYAHSFSATGAPLIATARAGNVIGGGDFTADRLVPDLMRALMVQASFTLAHPQSVRPWQHVLEPLGGYLWLGARLLEEGSAFGGAWNFAPLELEGVTTQAVVEEAIRLWGKGAWLHQPAARPQKETGMLRLSREKAANELNWRPVYNWREALAATVSWYQRYQRHTEEQSRHDAMYALSASQIERYTEQARRLQLPWSA